MQFSEHNIVKKFFFLWLALFYFASMQGVRASHDFFYVDWKSMPLDSVMPRYTEVIPLESDYRVHDYKVRLLYPEWQEMSRDEAQKMSKWAEEVAEDLQVNTFVGVSRAKGMLDVDFLPVVRRNGKYYKLLSAKMQIEAVLREQGVQASSERKSLARVSEKSSERYARQSRLATGKWVKISIQEDGMYRLTRASLQKMGFKNPDNVHLYGYGGHRLSEVSNPESEYDDLVEVPLFRPRDGVWLFWGNGLVHWESGSRIFNPYANEACYFLTEEDAPSEIGVIEAGGETLGTPISVFTDYLLYEKDEFAYGQLGRNLFDAVDFGTTGAHAYSLNLPAHAGGNEKLTVSFTAAAEAVTTVTVQVNGTQVGTMNIPALQDYQCGTSAKKIFSLQDMVDGSDLRVKLIYTSGQGTSRPAAHLDYLALSFDRKIHATDKFMAFNPNRRGSGTICVKGFDLWSEVMRLGKVGEPAVIVRGRQQGDSLLFNTDDLGRSYVCFNTEYSYPEPKVIGMVENQNLHALDSLDMVIIIPASGKLLAQAERLAEVHRAVDGLRVQVVRADQVYNEFSSGTPDATAYRRLMKMLYDRADGDVNVMPRYLLLMGACSFDNRMLTSAMRKTSPNDYLLCFESEESFSDTRSYVMEDYFGLLDDGEGKSFTREKTDLAVGRFPVTTAEEARVMVDKVVDFVENRYAGAWKNVVMMMGDDGDRNSHMAYCDEVAELLIKNNPEMEVRKVMWDAYTRVSTTSNNTYPEVKEAIKKQLDEGVMVMNYTGHGAPYVLSHEAVWKTEDIEAFKGKKLPVWFTAACDVAPMDATTTNIGVQGVLNEGGGALAFVGTARTVYATNNKNLNRYFTTYLFGKDERGRRYRLGDALRLAKVSLVEKENTYLENKLQYLLLGDPALLIGAPLDRVQIDEILDAETQKPVEVLSAGMMVQVNGSVVDQTGGHLSQFNGIVTARLFDSMDTITCRRNDTSISTAFQFTDRSSLLYAGRDSVRNGQFTLRFMVPKDIKYSNGAGRMVLYAVNDSLNIEANGYREDFTIGGMVDYTDNEGPRIELALNGETDMTDKVVNATPCLTAALSDSSGINFSGNGIGHDIVLTIDNNPEWTIVLNDYYESAFGDFTHGTLSYVLPQLPEGSHRLSLRAWDLLNNTSVAEMDFAVDNACKPNLLHLYNTPNPAVTSTTFVLSHDLTGSETEYLIEVFDFAGRRLWMHRGVGSSDTGQFLIPWNLSVGDGRGRISPGVYLYRASLRVGNSEKVTKTKKLLVN